MSDEHPPENEHDQRDAARDVVDAIPMQGQRQDSLTHQLATLRRAATRLGCYDAADWILAHLIVGKEDV
jgi:hypothetical protein